MSGQARTRSGEESTAAEMVRESERRRSEAFSVHGKPLYSLERIRRRALCEAALDGIPDGIVLKMREEIKSRARFYMGRRDDLRPDEVRAPKAAVMDGTMMAPRKDAYAELT